MLTILNKFIKTPIIVLTLLYFAVSFQIYNWLGVNTLWGGGEDVLLPRTYVICSTLLTYLMLQVSGWFEDDKDNK